MNVKEMKVVLLCGGEGLRFKNEHLISSKVMADVNGQPLILHIMKHYSCFGVKQFFLCVRDDDQVITQYFSQNIFPSDWKIEVIHTGNDTPTGGRILLLKEKINDDFFFVTYGDGLSDVNIHQLLLFHNKQATLATLTSIRPFSQYGILNVEENGIVSSFREKPRIDDWINGGFFVFNKLIFDYLSIDRSLEESIMDSLIPIGQLSAYQHSGFWKSIDTYKDYVELNQMMKNKLLQNS